MLNISGLKLPMIGDMLVGGNVYFVDSGSGVTNNENNGLHPTKGPLATITGALAKCTDANGDFIVCMPGHAETLTASIQVNKTGVTIIGVGNGDNMPTITVNANSIFGLNVAADDVKIHNMRVIAGASFGLSSRWARVAASDVVISACRFESAYVCYHNVVVISGDNVQILDSTFDYTDATDDTTGIKAQACILNIAGTNVLVKGCRFNDVLTSKSYGWPAVIEGGKLTASLTVQECTFICRGIATRTRSAAASGVMYTIDCRAISPSANTSAGAIYTYTYQYVIESYDVAAVNKHALIGVSTSDIRMKTKVVYF
jgi:hypothetical protein